MCEASGSVQRGRWADPKIGCIRRNWKFLLVMHSIGVGIVVQKRCVARRVRLRSAIEERAVLGVSDGVGRHEGAIRDYPFSSPRNASKTPCVSPDPYPWPDSSCGTFVWNRAAGRLRARRRAGPLRSGTIARELHAEPTRPGEHSRRAQEAEQTEGGVPRFIRAGLHLPAVQSARALRSASGLIRFLVASSRVSSITSRIAPSTSTRSFFGGAPLKRPQPADPVDQVTGLISVPHDAIRRCWFRPIFR
jgi:hypothetical protein